LFSQPVYVRGAMTLQALRMTVGDQAFFRVLRAWARQQRDGNGTTPEFIALAERVSGRSLSSLFDSWLYTESKPRRPTGAGVSPAAAPATSAARRAQVDAWVDRWNAGLRWRIAAAPGRRM